MSEMFYEEDIVRKPVRTGGSSKMSQWLMDKGIVKSEGAASMVLIGIAVVAIILTVYVAKGL